MISKKYSRLEMIDALVENDIISIKHSMQYDDYSFLGDILRGNSGWKQYSELSDSEIEIEYKEMEQQEISK